MNAGMKSRDIRLDTLRGLFLIIMAAVHVPTPLSHALQEPFGYTSAAEGFVFLGAAFAGYIYGKTYRQANWAAMSGRAWRRARQIYFVHLALVVPTALIAWAAANRVAPLANHFHDFLEHPWGSLALIPLLLHQPPLFDILPLYVILLGATPWVLAAARRYGWGGVLVVSALGWLIAQFKLDVHVIGDPSRWLPLRWSSFSILAWQFLWISGLAVGETMLRRPIIKREFRSALAALALPIVLAGLLSRHGYWPQAWFPPDLFLWLDKWTLGPLRVLNFAAWVVLMLAWNPQVPANLLSPMALLGRHSLAVFSVHVPLAIAATTMIQVLSLSTASRTVIGILVVGLLFPWAAWQEYNNRRQARILPPIPGIPALEPAVLAQALAKKCLSSGA